MVVKIYPRTHFKPEASQETMVPT